VRLRRSLRILGPCHVPMSTVRRPRSPATLSRRRLAVLSSCPALCSVRSSLSPHCAHLFGSALAPLLTRSSLRCSLAVASLCPFVRLRARSAPHSFLAAMLTRCRLTVPICSAPRSLRSSLVPRCDAHSLSPHCAHLFGSALAPLLARSSLRCSLAVASQALLDRHPGLPLRADVAGLRADQPVVRVLLHDVSRP